ncbi:putative bifunctional diguanylate cyclase/phosphodiesterase [Paenibacillus sp. HJGM_3]|uniref:putative bifunctional diguanylate cyclase/phosphodiesterase n=1 Tax=Paenibacillus sp. HJGM_3 TaxID=3379816 RepID=UPI00385CACD8
MMWTSGGMPVKAEKCQTPIATPDRLTGLPDRGFFMQVLIRKVSESVLQNTGLGVFVVALDQFRMLNITQGHEAADRALKTVADRLNSALCAHVDGAALARVGGDEFGAVLPCRTKETVMQLADRLLELIREPILVGSRVIRVAASIGISCAVGRVGPELSADSMWRDASLAIDEAKKAGGNQARLYNGDGAGRLQRRAQLGSRLAAAIARQELTLEYQPQVDLATRRITGLECLLRWNSRELGYIAPYEFVPIAEETGLIVELGDWVLREACRQSREWADRYGLQLPVSVNVSSRQFQERGLPERIESILRDTGLTPDGLELELTESLTLTQQAAASLQRLKRIGIRIALDDFGTGYSSLSYLQKLPIDILKIDQSFIREMTDSPVNLAIVQTIVALAQHLKLRVVAEGVESLESARLLQGMRCHAAQGYYFSQPVAAERVAGLVRDWALCPIEETNDNK